MRTACFALAGVLLVATAVEALAEDIGRAVSAPPGTQTSRADEPTRPRGSPANQWRYQFHAGRWWYRTTNNSWSYYDGRRWRPYAAAQGYRGYKEYDRRPVDPALLSLEAKEGSLGNRKWPRAQSGTAAGGIMSGTHGSFGGEPTGSFTNSVGPHSPINTATTPSLYPWGSPGAARPPAGTGTF